MFIYNEFDKSYEDNEIMRQNVKNIINNILVLYSNLNIEDNDELALCNLYAYLLNEGYLSIDKEFNYSIDNIKHDYFNNIMLGYGCCRNISDGLKKVLDNKNIRNCILSTSFNIFDSESNHCINLIMSDNKYFMYDITNMYFVRKSLGFLRVLNARNTLMKVFNVKTTFEGEYYNKSMSLSIKDYDDGFSAVPIFKELQKYQPYSLNEYLKCYDENINTFKEKENLITKFYTDSYDDIKSVSSILIKR